LLQRSIIPPPAHKKLLVLSIDVTLKFSFACEASRIQLAPFRPGFNDDACPPSLPGVLHPKDDEAMPVGGIGIVTHLSGARNEKKGGQPHDEPAI